MILLILKQRHAPVSMSLEKLLDCKVRTCIFTGTAWHHYIVEQKKDALMRHSESKTKFVIAISLIQLFTTYSATFSRADGREPAVQKLIGEGHVFFGQGQFEKASQKFKAARDLAPDDFEANKYCGHSFGARKKNQESIKYFKRALELNPKVVDCWIGLAHVYIVNMKQRAEGEKAIAQLLIEVKDERAKIYYDISNVYVFAGIPDKALEYAQKSLDAGKDDLLPYATISEANAQMGRFDRSVSMFRKSLSAIPVDTCRRIADSLCKKSAFRYVLEVTADALKRYPGDAYLWKTQGFAAGRLENAPEAYRSLRRSIDLGNSEPEVLQACISNGLKCDKSGTKEFLKLAIAKAPTPQKLDSACLQMYAVGLTNEAISILTDAIKRSPGVASHYSTRARFYLELSEQDKAIKDLVKSTSLNPALNEDLRLIGNLYFTRGNFIDAEKSFLAETKTSTAPLPHCYLATVRIAQNRLKDAEAGLDSALKKFPDDASLHQLKGDVYQELQLMERALQEYSISARLDPSSDEALIKKGLCLDNMSREVESLLTLTEATRLNPLGRGYIGRANVFKRRYRDNAAIRDLTRSIENDISKAASLAYRASVYERCGEIDKAIQDYSTALSLIPADTASLRQRSKLYMTKGDYQRALQDADRAVRAEPQTQINYIQRARANKLTGQHQAAFDDYSIAIKMGPDTQLYRDRAAIRKLLKDDVGSQEDLKKALEFE